tara:strand:+ start:808 stop:2232 length:1425 start_codon:yes stop_codon:yes gene_type:complete
MLTGHKKSRYNIYDNLEFLGLNPYELKHFCFGEGEGSDGPGDSGEPGSPNTGPQTGPVGPTDMPSVDFFDKQGLSDPTKGAIGPGQPDSPRGSDMMGPTEPDDPIDEDFAGRGRPSGPADMPSVDYFDMQGLVDPFDIGLFGNITDKKEAVNAIKKINEVDPVRAQNILNARTVNPNVFGIPEMNALEKAGMKTFGLGYRGDFEARSPFGLLRDDYDPNSLTGAGTDEASTNKSMFAQFARDNRDLTTVEAVAQYNAISNPDQQVSISDVQSMGFDLNAAVGPQADFREAEAQRGFAQGLGLMAQTIAAGSPIGAITDIALSGRGEGYGKGVLGHFSDMVKDITDIELPELPDFGIPSTQEIALDLFGPEQDTMSPGSFDIGLSSLAEMSTPTDTDVGFTGFGTVGDYDLGFGGSEPIAPPPVQKPVIKEKEEVIETPSPAFPIRDTIPPSRVSRIANIYGIDENAAKRMLGIA